MTMTVGWTKAGGWTKAAVRAMSVLAAGVLAAPALAQGLGIPPRQDARSPTGVSYGSGAFTHEVRDLSIGGDFPQGLTLDRTYMSSVGYLSLGGLGWTHNWSGRISLQPVPLSTDMESPLNAPRRVPYIYNVTVGGRSAGFIGGSHFPPGTGYPQGTYEAITPTGASLVYTGTTSTDGYYIFTDSDGSVITFPYGGQPQQIVDWTAPDGTRLNFTYAGIYMQSAISTRGYALLFEPPNGSGQRKVCAVNMAQHYVTATSTCPAGAQSVTYSYAPPPADPTLIQLTAATDATGQTTAYGYQHVGGSTGIPSLTCITPPGQTGCQLQNAYSICHVWDVATSQWQWGDAYVVSQQTATGETYAFTYSFPDTDPPHCNGGPSSETVMTVNATAVTHVNAGGGVPGVIVDPLGRSTSFRYMTNETWATEPGALVGVTSPLGNAIDAVNDARGNITQQTQAAIPGSGLAARTTIAVFPASCISTNRRICNQPTSVTDANGNTTDYTYDAAHGGVLTETAPAVGGVRPQTRHEYAQRYAWIKTSGGGYAQAATPIWVRTATSSCRTSAATGTPSAPCATAGDEVRTAYDYGPNSGPNTLLLRGQTVTATDGGVTTTLRTCYGYDPQGNKISETTPNAGLASCP